jgi:hypothetical protein
VLFFPNAVLIIRDESCEKVGKKGKIILEELRQQDTKARSTKA